VRELPERSPWARPLRRSDYRARPLRRRGPRLRRHRAQEATGPGRRPPRPPPPPPARPGATGCRVSWLWRRELGLSSLPTSTARQRAGKSWEPASRNRVSADPGSIGVPCRLRPGPDLR
jgi:hypothetical protein